MQINELAKALSMKVLRIQHIVDVLSPGRPIGLSKCFGWFREHAREGSSSDRGGVPRSAPYHPAPKRAEARKILVRLTGREVEFV